MKVKVQRRVYQTNQRDPRLEDDSGSLQRASFRIRAQRYLRFGLLSLTVIFSVLILSKHLGGSEEEMASDVGIHFNWNQSVRGLFRGVILPQPPSDLTDSGADEDSTDSEDLFETDDQGSSMPEMNDEAILDSIEDPDSKIDEPEALKPLDLVGHAVSTDDIDQNSALSVPTISDDSAGDVSSSEVSSSDQNVTEEHPMIQCDQHPEECSDNSAPLELVSGSSSAGQTPQSVNTLKAWRLVCIIGNAEKESDAVRIHSMWGGLFTSLWFVWGTADKEAPAVRPSNLLLYRSKDKKTWAQGISYLLSLAKSQFDCEYIFTHDDDLEFSVKHNDGTAVNIIADVLIKILVKHQPMVAGFPWTAGDTKTPAAASLSAKYADADVAPLAGFDSGMVIYHHSIVDMFIPFSPRGEGGFTGEWSLCAHFLNMFAPLTFRGAAIRINALQYKNRINLDNTPRNQRGPGKVGASGLVVHDPMHSRHPYEYKFNRQYMRFLSSGMKVIGQRWGRELETVDITWDVDVVPQPIGAALPTVSDLLTFDKRPENLFRNFTSEHVLNQISSFYDISHPAVSSNTYLRSRFTVEQLRARMRLQDQTFSFVIHVFTMSRRKSFIRLWSSINAANSIAPRQVSIVIHVDAVPDDSPGRPSFPGASAEYAAFLKSVTSRHGRVSVTLNSKNLGLKNSIMDAWTPLARSEFAIFLEDDISVSPHFLEYAEQMVARYLHPGSARTRRADSCIGVSLYRPRWQEVSDAAWTVNTGPHYAPYILQHPQSWGGVFTADGWSRFVAWYSALPADFEPVIPMSLTNRWPSLRSWKKYMMRFMYETGAFMIYPNLPGGLSLSTNHREVGENDRLSADSVGSARKLWEQMRERFTVPLLDLTDLAKDSVAVAAGRAGIDEDAVMFFRSMTEAAKPGDLIGSLRLNLSNGVGWKDGVSLKDIVVPSRPNNVNMKKSHSKKSAKRNDGQKTRRNIPSAAKPNELSKLVSTGHNPAPEKLEWIGGFIGQSLHLPNLDQMEVFNITYQPAATIDSLLTEARPTRFDKCTMVMPVYSRHAKILERLRFYHTHPLLDSIILVWNNPNVKPPQVSYETLSTTSAKKMRKVKKGSKWSTFNIPVHIKVQTVNSMNNRYYPFEEIKTDCVISMDDDWNMPHDQMTFAIRLWQSNFFNHLVGFKHLGRVHKRDKTLAAVTTGGVWKYRKATDFGVSMVLPSGAVYHKRYHTMYTHELPKSARDEVERLTNCDDILFNMMVANATRSGPVVIDTYSRPLDMGDGLWRVPNHFAERSSCLQRFFDREFGGRMPLRYTVKFFVDDKEARVLPRLKDLVSVEEEPTQPVSSPQVKVRPKRKKTKKAAKARIRRTTKS